MLKDERDRFEEKVQVLRTENETLKDEIQVMKVDSSKEIALKDQKHEFLQNKYSDLQVSSKVRISDLEKQFDALR